MCIPNTQCRLYEITKRSDASRQPGFFSSHVPGYQANMANWLCYSETLIFTQLTKSLWRSRVLHAFCWACQTSRLPGQQMQFLEAICLKKKIKEIKERKEKETFFFLSINALLDHHPLQVSLEQPMLFLAFNSGPQHRHVPRCYLERFIDGQETGNNIYLHVGRKQINLMREYPGREPSNGLNKIK